MKNPHGGRPRGYAMNRFRREMQLRPDRRHGVGFLIGLILIFALGVARATDNSAWLTRGWQTDDGLPDNHVRAIAQTADGYLWVATTAGLARFNGVTFTNVPLGGNAGSDGQGIRTIVSSRSGGIWIVPSHGPAMNWSPISSPVTPAARGLPNSSPWAVAEDGDGDLWLAYAGAAIYQVKNGEAIQLKAEDGLPMSAESIYSFMADSAGHLWLSTGRQVRMIRDGKSRTLSEFSGKARLAAATSGGVWVGVGRQLFKCEDDGQPQPVGEFTPENPHAEVNVLLEDHLGGVWIGTDSSGLFRYDGSHFEKVETSHPYILSLKEDREGNLWVGTAGGGMNRISPRTVQLESVDGGSSEGRDPVGL